MAKLNLAPITMPPGFSVEQLMQIEEHMLWDAKGVERRLVAAVKVVERAVRNPRPNGAKAAWPTWLYDDEDLAGHNPDDATPSRTIPRFRINEMEQAILWQSLYLKGHDGPARVLRTYLRCRAYNKSFVAACKDAGWPRATAYRARDKALTIIAYCLMRDGVPPR